MHPRYAAGLALIHGAPPGGKNDPTQRSISKGPLDLFTAATRLNSAPSLPSGSPLSNTFLAINQTAAIMFSTSHVNPLPAAFSWHFCSSNFCGTQIL